MATELLGFPRRKFLHSSTLHFVKRFHHVGSRLNMIKTWPQFGSLSPSQGLSSAKASQDIPTYLRTWLLDCRHLYIHTYIPTYIHFLCLQKHIYIYRRTYIHACMQTNTRTYVCVYIHTYTQIHMCIHTFIITYISVCMHTMCTLLYVPMSQHELQAIAVHAVVFL